MNTPRAAQPVRSQRRAAPSAGYRTLLLVGALIAATCLLLVYVNLLQESVARGHQLREEQRSTGSRVVSKPVVVDLARR